MRQFTSSKSQVIFAVDYTSGLDRVGLAQSGSSQCASTEVMDRPSDRDCIVILEKLVKGPPNNVLRLENLILAFAFPRNVVPEAVVMMLPVSITVPRFFSRPIRKIKTPNEAIFVTD